MANYEKRWFMWDHARLRRFDREEFLLVADKLQKLGYNGIGLYLEGAFDFKSIDGILRDGVMTYDDARWAKAECEKRGIFLFPMTNVVGHMEHFLRQERFKNMKISHDSTSYDIAFQKPEAEEFAMKIIHEYLDAFDLKYIHIGGDEVKLNDENKPVYAKFLAKLCDNLLAEGVKPGIWDDMLWSHNELCEPFSRDVEIFDWFYYAHRKTSIEYFVEQGFKHIYVCPCENSWIGFANHQFSSAWAKGDNIPVTNDEIEAFLNDGVECEAYKERNALITHWEASQGRDLWGQWSALARAGLFMTGDLKNQEQDDEKIERAIFGRVTPYTAITRTIQDEIHQPIIDWYAAANGKATVTQCSPLRRFLFIPNEFRSVLVNTAFRSLIDYDVINKAIDKCDALLKTWTPEGAFEERCFISMTSIVSMMRAAFALHKAAADCRKYYTVAAEKQFTEPDEAKKLVINFAEGFKAANEQIDIYREDILRLIECTGHTATDLLKLDVIMDLIDSLVDYLEDFAMTDTFDRIPLPAFEYLLDWIVCLSPLER